MPFTAPTYIVDPENMLRRYTSIGNNIVTSNLATSLEQSQMKFIFAGFDNQVSLNGWNNE
jgi:hypothetical protein